MEPVEEAQRVRTVSAAELRAEAGLFRAEEAAQVLGVGRTTVFKLIRVGEKRTAAGLDPFPGLRSVKIGDARRVPASALREYVRQLEQLPQGEAA